MVAYRPEIDGLRAVAIVPVVLFHAGFNGWSGGFVGVDVFFVISGFLITSLIQKEYEAGEFSFLGFYERRIRRLLPPLIPVLLFANAFTLVLYSWRDFKDFSESLVAFLGFSANWHFLTETGYFDAPAEIKPLQHVWSLSIEEQYYLVFPAILIFLLWRTKRGHVAFALIASVISFALATNWVLGDHGDIAFFNSFARVWELMIGSLLAFGIIARPANERLASALRFAGLAMIAFAVFSYDESTQFPGIGALLPTVGTALIILAGTASRGFIYAGLASRPAVYIGKISYALYLWHWVLFVFIRIYWPNAGQSYFIAGTAGAFMLAAASYQFIETPVRRKTVFAKRRQIYLALFSSIGIFGISGAVGVVTDGLPQRAAWFLPEDHRELLARFEGHVETTPIGKRAHACSMYETGQTFSEFSETIDRCLTIDPERPNYLVLGDSHAANLYVALTHAYADANFLQATGASCDVGRYQREGHRCRALWDYAIDYARDNGVDGIILTTRQDAKNYGADAADLIVSLFAPPPDGLPVVVFGPNYRLTPRPTQLIWYFRGNLDDAERVLNEEIVLGRYAGIDQFSSSIRAHGISYIEKTDFTCPDSWCIFWTQSGVPIFSDSDHWTSQGAAVIARAGQRGISACQRLFCTIFGHDAVTVGQFSTWFSRFPA